MKISQEGQGHRNGQSSFGDMMGRESRSEQGGKGRRSSRGQNQMTRQSGSNDGQRSGNPNRASNSSGSSNGRETIVFSQQDQQKITQQFNADIERFNTISSNTGLPTQNEKPLTGRFAPSSEPKGTQTIEQAFENKQPQSKISLLLQQLFR